MNVSAEVAGTVTEVLVRPGDSVTEGEVLVLVESMKMEIPVAAPCAGVVHGLRVDVGDSVNEGEPLVTVDPGGA